MERKEQKIDLPQWRKIHDFGRIPQTRQAHPNKDSGDGAPVEAGEETSKTQDQPLQHLEGKKTYDTKETLRYSRAGITEPTGIVV